MSVSVREILASSAWRAALARARDDYTQTVMGKSATPDARDRALMKFHLLDELEADLSQRTKE